ncbi:MAG: hypothetical protein P8Y04_05935 [Desulfobulbaceae bacterium]
MRQHIGGNEVGYSGARIAHNEEVYLHGLQGVDGVEQAFTLDA